MALRGELSRTLQDLTKKQFKHFKFFLLDASILEGLSSIPQDDLEKADRSDTVRQILQKYLDHGALKVTLKVLEEIGRNDLVQRLQNFSSRTKAPKTLDVAQTEGYYNAVEVTLDPGTAHLAPLLTDDRKQAHDDDVWEKRTDNPKRFKRCINELEEQSLSPGKVPVEGKTGKTKESIKVKKKKPFNPEDDLLLKNGDKHKGCAAPSVLCLKSHPQRVGVFVDYEKGLVSFYDVDSAALLYSFTGCSFTEKLYPFFSLCTSASGVNSRPLTISLVNQFSEKKKEYERKKLELKSAQLFSVDVTLDPDTAHPNLILSDDGKQVCHGDVWQNLPDSPKRFDFCFNVLGKESFSSRRFYFEVQVKGKTGWIVGVAKESIKRRGNTLLSPEEGFCLIWLDNGSVYKAIDHPVVHLSLNQHPQKVGVFVDYKDGLVSFYDVDSAALLYSFTGCSFTEKLYPFFNPCINSSGVNSAALIISPVNHTLDLKTHDLSDKKKEYKRKKLELKSVQLFSVDVTLDPDTAHPNLILSEDGKQVHCDNVRQNLPDSPKRFNSCVNVLGKESFSSGRFYFEVQVKGKTAWTVGVAEESIKRRGDEYKAIDGQIVHLPLNQHLQKVQVFSHCKDGLASFNDVDSAALPPYSFTERSFSERLHPGISPCTNSNGVKSAPMVISPVNHQLNLQTHDFSDHKKEYERKKAELKSVQRFSVDVTLDPDTAHPNLILSDDGKQVCHGDLWQNLPDSPKRFDFCFNVLGKESFSSGRFYFEVQVKGKTGWIVGVAKESIKRRGNVTFRPVDGSWIIWLNNGGVCKAMDDPLVRLPLNQHPCKVGVFVHYKDGLVSFYDVEAADLLYSFKGCSFTGKLLPYISPCHNDNSRNSAPLIICPVNHND
ncbi:uncharacterized protein [Trachinotus anak]|uniref:uncharacterized protein n=1 Tax=Trachinotus anak TaxID=443729 RepID=UPI0039F17A1C